MNTTLKVVFNTTENALANKHEKRNNCKMFAITGLFQCSALRLLFP